MTTHWILRVGNGENFINSSKYKIWGIQTLTSPHGKNFIKNVKVGDILWFVKNKSQGKIIAVATFCYYNNRDFGPLIDISMTNEELGWLNDETNWISNIEIHYNNLYGLNNCELLTNIKGPTTIRKYDKNCKINLPNEYNFIVKYSKINIFN